MFIREFLKEKWWSAFFELVNGIWSSCLQEDMSIAVCVLLNNEMGSFVGLRHFVVNKLFLYIMTKNRNRLQCVHTTRHE